MCIRSVILGELENYIILTRNWKGFSITFPKILDAIYCIAKVRILHIPFSVICLNSKILGCLFSTKNIISFGVKLKKT